MRDTIGHPQPPARVYPTAKATLDFAAALALSILLAPVMLVVMVLVKLTSRGPAVYSQERVGLDGRSYTIYKFRTMRNNCEAVSGPRWSHGKDSRVTPLGNVLRKTHLDELPQLWNVLKGEMSLIGPRPERPVFVATLEDAIPGYRDRLLVRPGVTGLAQIQLPPDTDLESVRRKLVRDVYYVRHADLWLDLRILMVTGLGLFLIPHATSCRLLRLPDLAEAADAQGPEEPSDSAESDVRDADSESVARMQPA